MIKEVLTLADVVYSYIRLSTWFVRTFLRAADANMLLKMTDHRNRSFLDGETIFFWQCR